MNEEKATAQGNASAGVPMAQLEKVLADRGIDPADIAASIEQIKQMVDAGEVVLTQTMIDDAAAALDELQKGEGELNEEQLESVAGGAFIPWLVFLVAGKIASDCLNEPESVAEAFNDGRELAKKY